MIAIATAIGAIKNHGHGYYPVLDLSKFWNKVILILAVIVTLMFFYAGDTAFIYFQF